MRSLAPCPAGALLALLLTSACSSRNPLYATGPGQQRDGSEAAEPDAGSSSGPRDGGPEGTRPDAAPVALDALVPADSSSDLSAPPADARVMSGLKAEYFIGRSVDVPPILTTVDREINFSWVGKPPRPGVPEDEFSIRWTGRVTPKYSETYTFKTVTDDGVRLYIDGVQHINQWIDQSGKPHTATVPLTAGHRHQIEMHYYDGVLTATARLYWSSRSQPEQIVPEGALSHP